jgi:hypothetical protein
MEKDLKDILLKDLCGRLPYGVKVQYQVGSQLPDIKVFNGKQYDELRTVSYLDDWLKCTFKPYLFPLSSMTEEQKAELEMLVVGVEDLFKSFLIEVEFYHKNHIDYEHLIEKGLAIDATGLNIY